MFHPPSGWHVHDFWGNLAVVAHGHSTALSLAIAAAALLVLGRALLPSTERVRLRIGFATLIVYFGSLPLRAALLSNDLETYYDEAQLIGTVALSWAIIGAAGLLVFDLVGRRLGVPKILRDLTVLIANAIVLVVLLREAGVNLLSIVTTSAVVTAVIGLALQDTIGNLLSGVALQLESSIKIGDWIRVDEKPIGKVREIRWRSTVIQTKNGDLVIIPNALVTKGTITNFNKDGLENRRWVYFSVGLRTPPNEVQKIVLAALQDVPNVSKTTPPDCIVWAFKESLVEYSVRYRLVDFLPDDPTDSEVRKRIWYALARAGIEIPFPAHNVVVTERDEKRSERHAERDHAARLDAIRRVSIFAPLDEGERERLASSARYAVFGKGEIILRAGAAGDSLYILHAGEVAVRIGVNGLEREVARLGPGQFFGEMSLMTGEPRHATVVAASDAECFVVDRAAFVDVLKGKESLVTEIGRLLHDRQAELHAERAGLDQEAARMQADRQALLGRIKSFFGFA